MRAKLNGLALIIVFTIAITGYTLAIKPLTVGHLNANLTIYGLAMPGQKVYIPKTEGMQTIIYKTGLNYSVDNYGNRYVVVSGNYQLEFSVGVDSSRLSINSDSSFPVWNNASDDYLEPNQMINSDNEDIIKTAKEITRDSKTTLEAISNLMLWVHGHIKYDEDYTNTTLSAVETLKTRRGVCDEFTNLYTALARSVNIPTRIVIGAVYTGSRWRNHAWAESLVGSKWIPVDPTFAEMGQIDATHIKIFTGPDYPAYLKPGSTEIISVTDAEYENYTLKLDIEPILNDSIAPRDIFTIGVKIKNNDRTIITPTYLLQTTEGFQVLGDNRGVVIVYPGKEVLLTWSVVSPYGEKDKYYIGLVGPLLDKLVEININKSLPVSNIPNLKIEEINAEQVGDKIIVRLFVENHGNVDFDNVAVKAYSKDLGLKMKYITLLVGESKEVEFEFPLVTGNQIFTVESSVGNVSDSKQINVLIQKKSNNNNGVVLKYIAEKSSALFWAMIGIIILIILFVLSVPAIKGKKIPFKGQKKWERLLKLGKK